MCMKKSKDVSVSVCVVQSACCFVFSHCFGPHGYRRQEPFPLLPKLPMNDFPPEAPNDLAAAKLILDVL